MFMSPIAPYLTTVLFQTHPLRRVGSVDKTGFIQLAHDARVDHFFGLDLADLGIARFQHSLHVAQSIERWEWFAVYTFQEILIGFLRAIGVGFKPSHYRFDHCRFVLWRYGEG